MLKGLTKPVNFKNEIAIANELFRSEQWDQALDHYKNAISEINRQLSENPEKSLPDFLIPVYIKAILALAECQLMVHQPDDCLTTLNHPLLFESDFHNMAISLQARALLAVENKERAIATLNNSVMPQNRQLDKYYIEAQISLSHLCFEAGDFKSCLTILLALLKHVNLIQEHQPKDSEHEIVLSKMQIQYHIALTHKASGSLNQYASHIELAYQAYCQYLSSPRAIQDQDMNLMALSVVSEYLLSLKSTDEIPDLGHSLVLLLNDVFVKAQEPIRIKATQALMLCIKHSYEHSNFCAGQAILNQVLGWIKQGFVPKSLISVICLLAANCYLQNQICSPKLASIFIDLALKYQRFLHPQEQDEAQMQALIMKLACMQYTENTEQENAIFDEIILLRDRFPKDKLFALSKLIAKLLSLFPQNNIKESSDCIKNFMKMYFDISLEDTNTKLRDLAISGNEDSCLPVLHEPIEKGYQALRNTALLPNSTVLAVINHKVKRY